MELLKERPEVLTLLNTVAQEQGLQNHTISSVQLNKKGEGNLSLLFIITISDSKKKLLDVVVKAAFLDEAARNSSPIEKAFLNEIYVYTEVLPALEKLKSDVPIFIPKCYKTLSETGKELLCLDNLKSHGFEVFDKTDLDDDHVSLIFKMYGQFHAYSFALQHQKPEEYRKVVEKLYNMYSVFLDNPSYGIEGFLKGQSEKVESFLVPGQDDVLIEKYKKYTGRGVVDQMTEVVTAKTEPSVILHGDCWSNNMMFKYKIKNGEKKLDEMRFLDLQIAKEGSPVCDLSYCFYSGVTKSLLDNLDKYLRIYHENFSAFFKKLGGDPKEMFSFDVLKQHWRKYARFGMIMAFGIQRMKSTERTEGAESVGTLNEEKYKMRIKELLNHMSKLDAL